MNELQYRFLLNRNPRKQQGFTIIELLVVVVMIGILAAIALPTFLNQTAKAKQAEAKSTISSINTAQSSYRNEHPSFAASIDLLAIGLPTNTANYTYSLTGTDTTASITAQAKDSALRGYSGGNVIFTNSNNEQAISSLICQAIVAGTDVPPPPTFTPTIILNPISCDVTQAKL